VSRAEQLRGGRRGDEPVDQDGGTVGDGGNDAGQVGAPHQTSLHPAAELNLTPRRSVIPGTGWYVAAADAVRPETIGVRPTPTVRDLM
jgi:hypothetical protein